MTSLEADPPRERHPLTRHLAIPIRLRYVRCAFTALAMMTLLVAGTGITPAAAAIPMRVCAPKGKCVTTTRYCLPSQGCGKAIYKEHKGYCSASVGCFTWKGKNYVYTGGPRPSAAQLIAAQKCAASLGITWLGAISGGFIGVTILGVPSAIWGCS